VQLVDQRDDCQKTWDSMRLAPTKWEGQALRYWPITMILVFSPLFIVPSSFTNSVILSLAIASTLAGGFLALWAHTFRNTFGSAVVSGLVTEESFPEYKRLSLKVEPLLASRWRYVFFLVLIALVLTANRSSIHSIGSMRAFFGAFPVLLAQFFVVFLGSGLCWVVSASAYWIYQVSVSDCLSLQPGHSDNCLGLANVGLCMLQAAAPLLTGTVCLALWVWGGHVAWFARHASRGALAFFRLDAAGIMLLIFSLAIVVVFLPVMGLHNRMALYKRTQDRRYCDLVKDQSALTTRALAGTFGITMQDCADRLELVQSMDPAVLRLSTWPFDRAALISYGITPLITVIASILKVILRP
jgi:hypothetical protein